MALGIIDIGIFILFMLVVVGVSLYVGRKERSSEDYFLAGRSLTWPLIGFSLIASNISTEHFVGMAGSAFGRLGLAIASYEWIAAVTLVIVAWWLLPRFLQAGIYTMPEYLEYRYDRTTRTIMAGYLLVLTVVAVLVTVLYSGSRGLDGVFGFSQMLVDRFGIEPEAARFWATWGGAWLIGIVAGVYTVYGGLKAVVWSDLIQGAGLLIGGVLVLYFGMKLIGGGEVTDMGVSGGSFLEGWATFNRENADKLHTVLPIDDVEIPWIALFTGLLIPNFFYWGLNQFITQRTLGARSLAEGQKGIFLACFFKLIIPFIIVFPGIIAFDLYGDELLAQSGGDMAKAGELAYPHLIAQVMPPVLRGVMLAALAGAVMSTFNSGINSAATMYTLDVHQRYINPSAEPAQQVRVGRAATAIIALIACLMAPLPGLFSGVFNYIQEIWGFISPAIVAAFFFGLLVPRAPTTAGKVALLVGPLIYALSRVPGWLLKGGGYAYDDTGMVVRVSGGMSDSVGGFTAAMFRYSQLPFLHHMFITLLVLIAIMTLMRLMRPLAQPQTLPVSQVDVRPHPLQYVYGGAILVAVAVLYFIFW